MSLLTYIHIGCGGWGRTWCTDVLPRLRTLGLAQAVAAVDIDAVALAAAAEPLELSPDRLYRDAGRAFAEREADFAVVVVPPAAHETMVDLALARGCHILCEKPIADTMAGCCRIHRKAETAGVKMAITMSHRFDQDKQTLEAAIRGGEHGRLNYLVYRFTHNCRAFGSWGEFRHRMADPLLVEGAVHHFDILRALSGADARTVYARTWNPPWGEYQGDSTALVIVEMTNGVRCLYEGAKANAATLNGWFNDYIRAECEHATLELDARRLRCLRGGPWEKPQATELPLHEQPVWTNAWLAELFCHWLQGGAPPPNTIADNLQCAALLFATIESSCAGSPVQVQEFLASQSHPTTMPKGAS